jgi:hypothetical protein
MPLPSRRELMSARLECRLTSWHYIPTDALHEIITWDRVRLELPQAPFWRYFWPCWHSELERKFSKGKKIVAILLLTKANAAIEEVLLRGLVDDDLPIRRDGKGILSRHDTNVSHIFSALNLNDTDDFLDYQWWVLRPDLKRNHTNALEISFRGHTAPESLFPGRVKIQTSRIFKGTFQPCSISDGVVSFDDAGCYGS